MQNLGNPNLRRIELCEDKSRGFQLRFQVLWGQLHNWAASRVQGIGRVGNAEPTGQSQNKSMRAHLDVLFHQNGEFAIYL